MISVVVPAYNEAAMLESSVAEIVDGLRVLGEPFEVLVVENGSTDGTPAIAERLAAATPEVFVHSLRVPDYGEALRTGLLQARGEEGVIFDADYYDLQFLKEAREILDPSEDPVGAVIVVGSKRAQGSRDERSYVRRSATHVLSAILQLGFGLSVSDTHGMKMVNLSVAREAARARHFGADLFDTELIIRAERAGYLVEEIPVHVRERRPSRTSILHRVPRTLTGLVRLRMTLGRAR